MATWCGLRVSGATFGTYLSTLCRNGLVDVYAGHVAVTDDGLAYAGVTGSEPVSTEEVGWARSPAGAADHVQTSMQRGAAGPRAVEFLGEPLAPCQRPHNPSNRYTTLPRKPKVTSVSE